MRSTAKRKNVFDDGLLDQYLRDISAFPLITRADEAALAIRIRAGDDDALNQLVRSNLRFVVSVAKKYHNRGVALSDLINEGNLGLIRAARRFDETKGIKFISYAVWWVRQAILQALAESRIVRIPLNRASDVHRLGRHAAVLGQELGRDPTTGEIAHDLHITEAEVERTLAISHGHLSLDAPGTSGEDSPMLDRLADTVHLPPDEEAFEKALIETVHESLSILRPREARVLRLYFGLDGDEPVTLEDIGDMLGVTRERVRQIKDRALLKLRHTSRKRALESFL